MLSSATARRKKCGKQGTAFAPGLACTSNNSGTRRSGSSCRAGLGEVASPHPDAVRRRQEAEARQRQRLQEANQQSANPAHWWDVRGSANIVLAETPSELANLMESAKHRAKLVVVKYFAPHCVACRTMFPKVKQIAETNPEVLFVKVNAGEDEMRAFCEDLGISKVPFFHFYEKGSLTREFTANLQTIGRLRAELATRRQLIQEVAAAKHQHA